MAATVHLRVRKHLFASVFKVVKIIRYAYDSNRENSLQEEFQTCFAAFADFPFKRYVWCTVGDR